MKKIMIVVLLSLSIANISCEKAKKEETPWYASFKKTYATMAVISITDNFLWPLNPKMIIFYRGKIGPLNMIGQKIEAIPRTLSRRVTNAPIELANSFAYNIFPALVISSIGKIIHNRNQKKKHKKAQEVL